MKMISVECPSCGAPLIISEDKEYAVCEYCDSKFKVEKDPIEAEIENKQRLQALQSKEKWQRLRAMLIPIWISVTAILIITAIIMVSVGSENTAAAGYFILTLAMLNACWGAIGIFVFGRNRDQRTDTEEVGIKLPQETANATGKNYEYLAQILRDAGFKRVSCVPMRDLNFFTQRKSGQIEKVLVDGETNFYGGDTYSANVKITIMYHSRG